MHQAPSRSGTGCGYNDNYAVMADRNHLAVLDLDTPRRSVYRLIKSDVARSTLARHALSAQGVWTKVDGMTSHLMPRLSDVTLAIPGLENQRNSGIDGNHARNRGNPPLQMVGNDPFIKQRDDKKGQTQQGHGSREEVDTSVCADQGTQCSE